MNALRGLSWYVRMYLLLIVSGIVALIVGLIIRSEDLRTIGFALEAIAGITVMVRDARRFLGR